MKLYLKKNHRQWYELGGISHRLYNYCVYLNLWNYDLPFANHNYYKHANMIVFDDIFVSHKTLLILSQILEHYSSYIDET